MSDDDSRYAVTLLLLWMDGRSEWISFLCYFTRLLVAMMNVPVRNPMNVLLLRVVASPSPPRSPPTVQRCLSPSRTHPQQCVVHLSPPSILYSSVLFLPCIPLHPVCSILPPTLDALCACICACACACVCVSFNRAALGPLQTWIPFLAWRGAHSHVRVIVWWRLGWGRRHHGQRLGRGPTQVGVRVGCSW